MLNFTDDRCDCARPRLGYRFRPTTLCPNGCLRWQRLVSPSGLEIWVELEPAENTSFFLGEVVIQQHPIRSFGNVIVFEVAVLGVAGQA